MHRCHKSCCIPEEAFAIALAAAFVLVEAACIHHGRACHSRHAWTERVSACGYYVSYGVTCADTNTVWQTAYHMVQVQLQLEFRSLRF